MGPTVRVYPGCRAPLGPAPRVDHALLEVGLQLGECGLYISMGPDASCILIRDLTLFERFTRYLCGDWDLPGLRRQRALLINRFKGSGFGFTQASESGWVRVEMNPRT